MFIFCSHHLLRYFDEIFLFFFTFKYPASNFYIVDSNLKTELRCIFSIIPMRYSYYCCNLFRSSMEFQMFYKITTLLLTLSSSIFSNRGLAAFSPTSRTHPSEFPLWKSMYAISASNSSKDDLMSSLVHTLETPEK